MCKRIQAAAEEIKAEWWRTGEDIGSLVPRYFVRVVEYETAELKAMSHALEMRNNDLELRIHQLEGECGHLQADKAELTAENERLTRDIDMVQGFRTNQQKTIEALRAKLEAAEKELALQRYRCEVAERDVAHAHSEAKRRCPDYPWMLKTASEAVWALGESLLGVEAANKQWIAKAEAAEKEIELQRELFRREIERGNLAEAALSTSEPSVQPQEPPHAE